MASNENEKYKQKIRLLRRKYKVSKDLNVTTYSCNDNVDPPPYKYTRGSTSKCSSKSQQKQTCAFNTAETEILDYTDQADCDGIQENFTVEEFLDQDSTKNYATLLAVSLNGMFLWGENMLVLADLSPDKTLQKFSYQVVVRAGDMLLCSCDASQSQMDRVLSLCLKNMEVEESDSESCMHRNTLQHLRLLEVGQWIHPETDYEVIPVSSEVMVVRQHLSFSTVYRQGSRLRCNCLQHETSSCPFITIFKKKLDMVETETLSEELLQCKECLEAERKTTSLMIQKSVSWKSIPFCSFFCTTDNPSNGKSPSVMCEKCGKDNTTFVTSSVLTLYGCKSLEDFHVPTSLCSCGGLLKFDGGDVGCLNMGNYIITHECLRDYLKLFLAEGFPIYSFYKQLGWHYVEAIYKIKDMSERNEYAKLLKGFSYNRFRLAWLSFLDLVDVGNDLAEGYCCPACGPNPTVVICDGVTLSFQRRFAVQSCEKQGHKQLDGSRFEMRIFIKVASFRKQLRILCSKDMTTDGGQLAELRKAAALYCSELHPVIQYFESIGFIPLHWKRFLKELSKDCAAIAMTMPSPELLPVLHSVVGGFKACHTKVLQKDFPILFDFWKAMEKDDEQLLSPIISRIIECIEYITCFLPHDTGDVPSNFDEGYNYYPKQPQLCMRGAYVLDSKKHDFDNCTKLQKRHGTLMPGLFTVECSHGICYGYTIMKNAESPDMPFTVFRTRFTPAPSMIVYDNACNLSHYALNRDPGFFKHTKFIVDRLHWHNHKNCSRGYKMNEFSSCSGINSQAAEQRNSSLKNLKSMLSYCNQDNFNKQLKFYLWFRNMLHVLKLREPEGRLEQCFKDLLRFFTRG